MWAGGSHGGAGWEGHTVVLGGRGTRWCWVGGGHVGGRGTRWCWVGGAHGGAGWEGDMVVLGGREGHTVVLGGRGTWWCWVGGAHGSAGWEGHMIVLGGERLGENGVVRCCCLLLTCHILSS